VSRPEPLRILALLEATSITGTAKAVLEMAYESRADLSSARPVEIYVANFVRGQKDPQNALTQAMQTAQIPFSCVREQRRFDSMVMPQIQSLAGQYQAQMVWTNSVKSHFLVHRAGVRKNCKWVAFHHGYTSTDLKMRLYNELDRISLPKADRVLTVCRPFADQLAARGVDRTRLRVQHMPVRPFLISPGDPAKLRNELGLPPDAKVILSVGRLSHEKGHSDLIAAFTLLRNQLFGETLRLVLVGDGPERGKLEQQARASSAQKEILFTGHRDDAKRFYGIANVFALPSYSEGTPNVLLESMAAGVPVVTTWVGGIPELAADTENALLVAPKKPKAMADALQKLVQSPVLRNELTQAAHRVVDAHTPRAYFEQMREIFFEAAAC
jgi:glycosyltransferase involved in cell wall biosynthesis